MDWSKNTPDFHQSRACSSPEQLIEVFFHKLSQPIGALYGTLELAAISNDPSQHSAAIAAALAETEKLTFLFRVMRSFFCEDFTQGGQRVSLNSSLEDALQNCRPLAEDGGVKLQCNLQPELIVLANPRHLTHALENLLAHCIRTGGSGDKVQVDTSCDQYTILLKIADHTAWSAEQASELFHPFPPGHEVLPGKSNNLDLCLSRRIIQALGGEICACPSPTLTRVLEVTLPRAHQNKQ